MMLETMKELIGVAHVRDDEEEVPNVKRMHIGEEEVSLLQPIIVAVSPEEEDAPVPQGLRRLPPEEEEVPTPLVVVSLEGRGCLVPVSPLVSSLPFFFFSKMQDIFLALFLINVVDL
jgi:hypothetical protein